MFYYHEPKTGKDVFDYSFETLPETKTTTKKQTKEAVKIFSPVVRIFLPQQKLFLPCENFTPAATFFLRQTILTFPW